MKKVLSLFLLMISLLITSCGTNNGNLRIDIKIDANEVETLYIEYERPKVSENNFKCYTNDKVLVKDLLKYLSYQPLGEKVVKKDPSDYDHKLFLYFIFEDKQIYDFKAYIYGFGGNYFVMDDKTTYTCYIFINDFLEFINDHSENITYISGGIKDEENI